MPAPDLALLVEAAREAGRIAVGYAAGENRVWSKGKDDPVTEADLAVDRFLRESLTGQRQGYGWLSEESEDDPSRLAAERVFVVDPIDGTRSFIAGERSWAHSLAVVDHEGPRAAVVYLPMKDRLYAAARGGGATLNGEPIRTSGREALDGATLLAPKAVLEPRFWGGNVPPVSRVFRPSLAYRICLVGEGRYDGMLTIRDSWEWDVAAGTLIAAEAGARVTDARGQPLVFNNPRPTTRGVLAAGPRLHEKLAGRLVSEPARNGP